MNKKDGLPVRPASTVASTVGSNDDNTTSDQPHGHLRSSLTPTQTDFNGCLKNFELNFKEEEVDLLNFMMRINKITFNKINQNATFSRSKHDHTHQWRRRGTRQNRAILAHRHGSR